MSSLHFQSNENMSYSESQVGGPQWTCLIPTEDIEKTRDQLLVALEAGKEELLPNIYIAFGQKMSKVYFLSILYKPNRKTD